MPLIPKPNYNQIFASQAPEQDKPAVFNNYPLGWGVESRPNNGKPTIKGFNYLQQTSDLKDLWILQNGACLPYDESIEYAEGAPVLKDGVIQYKVGSGFKSRDSVTVPTYNSSADGVGLVTGVADGAYFNVRSSSDESYVDEYQNIGGVPTPTGNSYPSVLGVQQQEKPASTIKDVSGKNQQQLNEITKSLYNFNPDPTATISSQVSVLDYLQTLPLNPTPIESPKGFANGGVIRIPKGRYLITEPIKLKRGTRICGESHESTQIISRSLTGVFVYEDDGGYVPDEIVFENISIWQDAAYVPTAGAAIQVKEGAYTSAVQFILNNVMIEGTYKGVEVISGIGCSFDNVSVLKAISHGIDINNKGNNSLSTTSTTLKNTYTFLCGGNGTNVVGSSYVGLVGTASDSNTGYGYNIVGANAINLVGVGAERNTLGNVYMKDITSANLAGHFVTQAGAVNGITLNNVSGLTISGTNILADAGNAGNAIHFEASPRIVTFIGGYIQNFASKSNNLNNILFLSGQNGTGVIRGGDTNNWTFGQVATTDKTAQIANAGTAETTTIHGIKNVITYAAAGATYNTGIFNQVITAATAVTYPLVVGHYIENAFAGAGSTITRSAGQYIKEQTRGSTSNANLMIDATQGTIPTGNWSIYSDSTRPSYFKGPLTIKPASSANPLNNGDMTFEKTSNTVLTIKVRGDDGVVRSATLALA